VVGIGGVVLALVLVVVAGEFKDPVGVDLVDIVDIVVGALDYLVVDNPLGVDHAGNGSGVQGQPLLRPDIQIAAVALDLRYISEISRQNASEDGLMLVLRRLELVDLPAGLPAELVLHLLRLTFKTVEPLYLPQQLVVDLEGLLHSRNSDFVLTADAFSIVRVAVMAAKEKVDQS
jgi:hypothetical protein